MSAPPPIPKFLPGEEALAFDTRVSGVYPERFGTIIRYEGPWAIVVAFNDEMRKRALKNKKAVTEVRRSASEEEA